MRCYLSSLLIAMTMAFIAGCASKEAEAPKKEKAPKPAPTMKTEAPQPPKPAPKPGTRLCTEIKEDTCVQPSTAFKSDVELIHVRHVGVGRQKKGQEYSVRWIAEDVGKMAPPNFKIDEYKGKWLTTLKGANHYKISGSLPRPKKGWPLGQYRVEIHVGKKQVAKLQFKLEIAVNLTEVFEDKDLGFSIKYPAHWTFTKPKPEVVVFGGKDPSSPEHYSTVEIQALPKGSSVAKQMKQLKKQLEDPAKKGRVFDEQPFELATAKVKGRSMKAEYQVEEVAFRQWQLVLPAVKEKRLVYTWAYTAHKINYDRHLPLAQAMLGTWQLLK